MSRYIALLESALQSLTYLLPGRFQDAELVSEAVYTAIHSIKLSCHNVLDLDPIDFQRLQSSLPLAQQYYYACLRKDAGMRKPSSKSNKKNWILNYLLKILLFQQQYQVVLEMVALRQLGDRSRLKVILLLECIKFLLKVSIWMVLKKAKFQRVDLKRFLSEQHVLQSTFPSLKDDIKLSDETASCSTGNFYLGESSHQLYPRLPNDPCLKTLSGQGRQVRQLLSSRVPSLSSLQPTLLSFASDHPIRHMTELVYFLRPLLYVALTYYYGSKSWKPWLLSLLLEACRNQLLERQEMNLSELDKSENTQRTLDLLLYAVRDPFYSNFIKPVLDSFLQPLSESRIFGSIGVSLKAYQRLMEQIYYYTLSS